MNTINAPVQFDFNSNSIRITIDGSGDPWFLASDVCAVLGYKNTSKAIADHCRQGGITKRYTPTESGVQEMTYINEGNLYRLIIKSRKPEADPFETWVCDEVLPTIRKTGRYEHPKYGLKQLPEPPTITKAQQGILFNKVTNIAAGRGQIRTQIWSRFQNHFKLSSYKNLPADQFDEALAYLDAKNNEYNQGLEMMYVSNVELAALVDERVKAIEGELLPKKKPSTSVTLTFDGEEHQKFLVNMNPLYTTVSKLAHDELIIRKGDYYLMKGKDEVSVEKLVLDYIPAQLLPRLVEVAGQRMGRIELSQ